MLNETFEEKIQLDKDRLDEQSFGQAKLYNEYGQQWVKAVRQRDRCKAAVDKARVDAGADIRKHPEKFGWQKDKEATDTFVNSVIPNHPFVVTAIEKLDDAQEEVNSTQIMKEAVSQRGQQLDVVARLYTGGYFSNKPVTSHILSEASIENTEQSHREAAILKTKARLTKKEK
jgi:hypothetical protein